MPPYLINDTQKVVQLMRDGYSLTVYPGMGDSQGKRPLPTVSLFKYGALNGGKTSDNKYVSVATWRKLQKAGTIKLVTGKKTRNIGGQRYILK